MALPTASTPGYTLFRGFVSCTCLAQWLPVYERLLLAHGLIKSSIDIWQLTGGAPASGGTHTQGGAWDLLYETGPAYVALAREMGAPATWSRVIAQGFAKDHTHGVLLGCPHNSPAAYQLTAQRRGYNGLGQGAPGTQYAGMWGYGHPDEYPPPTTYRTWQQGIAWALVEIAHLTAPPPAPTPVAPQEVDMQFTDVIPGTNPPVTVGQALLRGLHAYGQATAGGWLRETVVASRDQTNKQGAALGALADDVSAIPDTVKQILKDAAVQVNVDVQYPTPPA